jgi:glycosyltransferase domain-containing protein
LIDLSNLTIIIPTFNRQDYALRNMSFWSSTNANIHILDGSKYEIDNSLLSKFATNINYHHYPVSFSERIAIAASFIKTKYAVLLGDDDFFLLSGLSACIYELETDPQYISCIGRTVSFYVKKNEIHGDLEYVEMGNYAVTNNDPFHRMKYHMNPYCCSILYSVIRSDHWKKAASLVSLSNFPDLGLIELQFELAICFLGKSKVIPNLMWMRSYENPSLYDGKQISFHNWWHDINYIHLKTNLISNFSKTLNYENLYQDEYFKNKTDEAYTAYVEWAKKYTSKLDLVDNRVIRLKHSLVKIKNRILTKNLKTKMIKFKDQGIIVNSEEVDSFIYFILKFYKKNGI